MCGLGGYQLRPGVFDPAKERWLDTVLSIQHARGPDDSGSWISDDRRTGLCHNRLAILDVSSAGHQPMSLDVSGLTIVFNGEIYNWEELRKGIEADGVALRSRTDTEVLLHLYARYGEAMLPMLRGMFAFVIHDARNDTLLLARDRLGKKPLVWTETSDGFAFASGMPAVLQFPGCQRRLNRAALAAMLLHNLRHIPDPSTIWQDVRRLRPGHAILVCGGKVRRNWRWWKPIAATGQVTVTRLRGAIEDAVRLRMVADVPIGALLSGGVDSSAIVHLMTRMSEKPVRTYALGLDRDDEDLRRARMMAQRLGCVHREFYFDPKVQWEVLGKLVAAHGEPIMLLPLLHTYELCRAIRDDGIKVVLSGHGADELFCGYTGHVRTAAFSKVLPWVSPLARLLTPLPRSWRGEALCVAGAQKGQRKAELYRYKEAEAWDGIIGCDARARMANIAAEELAYWGVETPSPAYIEESNFTGLLVENTASVTTATDLPAMEHGIEMRAPFLDQELLSLALATPLVDKVPGRDLSRLKDILKRSVSDLVPHDLLYANKRGFGMGISEGDLLCGAWRPMAEDVFARVDDMEGTFDVNGVTRAWRSFVDHGQGRADRLAKILAIQLWSRQHT